MADSPKISFADFITIAANLDDCIELNNAAAVGADPNATVSAEQYAEQRRQSDAAYRQAAAERRRYGRV